VQGLTITMQIVLSVSDTIYFKIYSTISDQLTESKPILFLIFVDHFRFIAFLESFAKYPNFEKEV
jgi:hypothetical protein